MVIEESGMIFGNFPEEMVFHIEISEQYKTSLCNNGIKSCEFVLRRDIPAKGKFLYFVEAKTSCPNSKNKEGSDNFAAYIHDITEKITHSLTLYGSILLNRFSTGGVPEKLLDNDLSQCVICPVLVVKTAQMEWLIPYRDALNQKLRDVLRLWKIPQIVVINEEIAIQKGLVLKS